MQLIAESVGGPGRERGPVPATGPGEGQGNAGSNERIIARIAHRSP